jgi:hypothetical protein
MRVTGVEIGNDDLCVLERGERGLLPQNRWVPDGLDVSRGRRADLMGFGLGGSDRSSRNSADSLVVLPGLVPSSMSA